MYLADVIALQSILKAFNPATLGEQQDVASAKLFMIIDLNDVLQVIVLKLSQYLSHQFWKRLNDVHINITEDMLATDTLNQDYDEVATSIEQAFTIGAQFSSIDEIKKVAKEFGKQHNIVLAIL
ncbi:hypothetical protein G6F70_007579 [Rhizopus microsporus]|nr:hypothetical protein G6F70_007579 [Rhizopus microsporus]KAG1208069.1 hypothetical protein G6F69_007532 [Rhizopus microsporus]KAG1229166.1 hypothetical protein G6F67_007343 [Rhizopus microsporus]